MWEDGISREAVLEHYGYEDTMEAHVAMGFWKKESVPERIGKLSDTLTETLDFQKKVRVIFEYDPNFPRAYLRIEGTKQAASGRKQPASTTDAQLRQGHPQGEIITPDALENQKREYLSLARKFHVPISAAIKYYDILSEPDR